VENNATDVLLKQELATPTNVHVIVNGLPTLNGVNAQNHAMEDPKTEPEPFNKRLLTVEWIALVNQLNSEIAICKDAQLIVNGVHGQTGTCAQEAAEEACKEELEPSLFRKEMEENDA